ncbi:PREDICTED: membrane metallo-endopeptidase-like 1 [Drosophila arizonae]|uniref:Membrane metallo-endopeptidase-like 1 n=1 Tax=Drosophila arizonae TaxID=7263 RepID=A0ABM1NVR1_DROAR|nr:PREDICTED: membrane metallo-endopeptidase-like 1 [Drosophila arizonae]
MIEIKKINSLICAVALTVSVLFATCVAKPAAETKPEIDDATIDNTIPANPNVEYLRAYATQMLSYMNRSVAPCDDFYEYACGNWKNVKQERQSQHKRSNLLDIVYTLADVAEELLLANTTLAEDLGYGAELRITQQFYNACLNAELYPLPAADPAYLALIKSVGGFPAVEGEAWLASNFSWFNMSSHLTNYGAQGLIYEKHLQQYPFMPYFRLPELGFDYIVHSDNIATNDTKGYKLNEKRMRGYLQAYGLPEEKIVEVIAGIFAFWREVLKIADRFEEDSDKCDLLTDEFFTEPFPQWKQYYEISWNNLRFDPYPAERYCDFFYYELDKVCAKHKVAAANYMAMKLLYTMDAKLKAAKYQRDHCILTIQYSMPYLLDKLYFVKYFTEEASAEVANIISELRKSHLTFLDNANWLDAETRKEALLKESTIVTRIGAFQDKNLSESLIRAISNLTVKPNNFPENNINLKRFSTYMKRYLGIHHKSLTNDTKPLELLVGMQVNAFYYNLDNSINVMAGILHPPSYDQAWPNSLKFGTLGYLVGHELTHGFDTIGATYDSNGTSRYWWSKKSGEVFNERSMCFVDHFNNYLIPEINRNINGNQTKDESIADSGGLRESMSAYRNHMKQLQLNGENNASYVDRDEQMPGLDLSPEQLFFLGFAQLWCADYEEKHYWEELTDEHPMDKYRVLGAVTNNDDFAQAYHCERGSPMHPIASKCRVW